MRTGFAAILIVCVASAAPGTLAGAADRSQRTVPCRERIDLTPFPYLGSAHKRHQLRLVIGAVMVPPAYLHQTAPTGDTPWRYFSKRGIVVKGGRSVIVRVPVAWRKRAAISWGSGEYGGFHTLRFAACDATPEQGNAYPGGFYLRRQSACVPLVFIVGSRRQTVWFGVGRRCR